MYKQSGLNSKHEQLFIYFFERLCMKMLRFFTVALLFGAMLVCLVPFAKANINVVASGKCSGNGRTWWMNVDMKADGTSGCVIGMYCTGTVYQRNCDNSLKNNPSTDVSVSASGGNVTVTVSVASDMRVYDLTGKIIYTRSSTVSAGSPTSINSSLWNSGSYIVVAFTSPLLMRLQVAQN